MLDVCWMFAVTFERSGATALLQRLQCIRLRVYFLTEKGKFTYLLHHILLLVLITFYYARIVRSSLRTGIHS